MAGPDDLLPKPQSMVLNGTESFALGRDVRLDDPTSCSLLAEVLGHYGCTITDDEAAPAVTVEIVSSIEDAFLHQVPQMPEEAYVLTVTANEVRIQALEQTGVIRAAQTLNQLAEGTMQLVRPACRH